MSPSATSWGRGLAATEKLPFQQPRGPSANPASPRSQLSVHWRLQCFCIAQDCYASTHGQVQEAARVLAQSPAPAITPSVAKSRACGGWA